MGVRTIRESHRASAALDAGRKKYARLDEAWTGISWFLARAPMDGPEVFAGVFMLKFASYIELEIAVPSITILYTYSEQFVDVISVKFSDED